MNLVCPKCRYPLIAEDVKKLHCPWCEKYICDIFWEEHERNMKMIRKEARDARAHLVLCISSMVLYAGLILSEVFIFRLYDQNYWRLASIVWYGLLYGLGFVLTRKVAKRYFLWRITEEEQDSASRKVFKVLQPDHEKVRQ